jgi:ribosomal protein S18 acetylase RimI-like enzyme
MIKIGPLIATDYAQTRSLLEEQEEPVLDVAPLTEASLMLRSFAFWQHWVPCQFHVTPSVYVAREEGEVLGFISLHTINKSKSCWRIDNLVVHPEHRGRGIAHELLRYVFALFGGQGVSHFAAEIAGTNDGALSLFAGGGFCRSAQVTYYKLNSEAVTEAEQQDTDVNYRMATQLHKQMLYQLHQDVLPPDLRLVLAQSSEDFAVKDSLAFTSVERNKNRLMRTRVWYWIGEDPDRKVLTSAVKVTAQPGIGYKLEFAVHPGWKHLTQDLVNFAVQQLQTNMPQMPVWARVYDFHPDVHEAVKAKGFERMGDYFLLTREHWQRAKRPKRAEAAALKKIGAPAMNLPLATERCS